MNITDLAVMPIPAAPEVSIRGRTVRPRMLTIADTAAIRRALPAPRAPLIKDPAKGSLTRDMIPDVHNQDYQRARATHLESVLLAEAVVALDLVLQDGRSWGACADDAARAAFIADASSALAAVATDAEIAAVAEAITRADRESSRAARESIIVAIDADRGGDAPDEQLPENYGQTRLYSLLRAAERFGMNPRELASLSAEDERLLLQYDRARRQEEARRDEALLRAAVPRM